jgi:hypothetical protein
MYSPVDADRWADIQYEAANEANADLIRVLAGQRPYFHLRLASGQVRPLDVCAVYARLMRFAQPADIAMIIAGVASPNPAIKTRGISKAQELLACLAGEHGDNVANAACNVAPNLHRYPSVSCSQCGNAFGPGNAGYSSCREHELRAAPTFYEANSLLEAVLPVLSNAITGDRNPDIEERYSDVETYLQRVKEFA